MNFMKKSKIAVMLLFYVLLFSACVNTSESTQQPKENQIEQQMISVFSLEDVPAYKGDAYVVINQNIPYFIDEEIRQTAYEEYSSLDDLDRCGVAIATVGIDIMPTEERGAIGQVKPTGWHTIKYDIVDGKYLYNRCHLLGYQLTGENANVENLITGTRAMNVDGMLPFENMIDDYVEETLNHVHYRVTPIFVDDELLARGVLMEAMSIEDNGVGVMFNVFCYNAQNGIEIDYATGMSWLSDAEKPEVEMVTEFDEVLFILNTSSDKIHLLDCSAVDQMSEKNKQESNELLANLEERGYTACQICLKAS